MIQGGYLDIALAGRAEAPLTADVPDVVQGTRVLAHPDEHGMAQSCKSFHRKRESWCWAKAPPFYSYSPSATPGSSRRRGGRGCRLWYRCRPHHLATPHAAAQVRGTTTIFPELLSLLVHAIEAHRELRRKKH